ncbi:MAG: HNH endonuclease [Candidatus Krumholzibacteria bacterium]|nr:HNH endonuclease [Candidatus Krumholzibacteria bacterium]
MHTITDHDPAVRLRTLSDRDLNSQTIALARDEREVTVQLLHHLGEIARRKLYLELGFSSLHDYCTRGLEYSSPAACRRIRAARCIKEFPSVLPLLERGELDLGTIALIEPVLTEDNHGAVVARVRGRTYRQVRRVVAEYGAPLSIPEERIEPVRALVTPSDVDRMLFDREVDRAMPHPSGRAHGSWVVSEQKMFVQFLAREELIAKYEEAKALLSQSRPNASFAEVLAVLLDEYIERRSPAARQRRREKKRAAAAGGKSSTVGADGGHERSDTTRHIPVCTRDEIFTRDEGQCTYVGPDGTLCQSRHALQIDHIRPYAAGGTSDPANLRLLCAAHNRLAAEHTLGRHVMARYWRQE